MSVSSKNYVKEHKLKSHI